MDSFNEIVKQIDQNGNIYEVAIVKAFEILEITIDVEASNATPYLLNDNAIRFDNAFQITQIHTQSETNALAGFLLKCDGSICPVLSYFLDATTLMKTMPLGAYTKGFWCNTTVRRYPDLDIKICKDANMRFYVYNTHTSAQEIYITILGYRIYERVLKPKP